MPICMEGMHCYCVYCRSGMEARLGEELERRFAPLKTLVAVQEKHKVILHHKEIERRVVFPGYLFLYSTEPIEFADIRRMAKVHRVLGEASSAYELLGSDREFALWLWKNEGIIGISKLCIEDGKLIILSGPLQYFAQNIVRLDKHTRNALVRMDFLERTSEIWLAFDFVK